jgi:hypothetical protein
VRGTSSVKASGTPSQGRLRTAQRHVAHLLA